MTRLTTAAQQAFIKFSATEADSLVSAAADDKGFVATEQASQLEGLRDTFEAVLEPGSNGMNAQTFRSIHRAFVQSAVNTGEVPGHLSDDLTRMFDVRTAQFGRELLASDTLKKIEKSVSQSRGEFVISNGHGEHLEVDVDAPHKSIREAVAEQAARDQLNERFSAIVEHNESSVEDVRLADLAVVYQSDTVRKPVAYGMLVELVPFSSIPPFRLEIFVAPSGELLIDR